MTDRPSLMAITFILLTISFTVLGQMLVKQGMLEVGESPFELATMPQFLWRALTNLRVLLGLGCAVIAALTWMVAISRSNLSFAYPFMTLSVVLVLVFSNIVFKETIPLNRWLGVLLVFFGVFIASR